MRYKIFIFLTILATITLAQPPYSGTIFIDPDIITPDAPSAIKTTTYTGQGMVTMYDRRVNDWVAVNAYLFDVVWDDSLTSRAQVNPEFATVEAATVEAEKYARLIGQLPTALRTDVDEIWIHMGVEPFGGGNNSILIHTGQTVNYENTGILEETLVHEACHTSLDAKHAASTEWINAQNNDGEFISTYARDNPGREDIAESFLPWLAVRYRQAKLSEKDYNNITKTIPSRLSYFDEQQFDLYPFEVALSISNYDIEELSLYPNPANDMLHINMENLKMSDISIFNLSGINLTHLTNFENQKLNISNLPAGQYLLKIRQAGYKVVKK